ncbi:MAG: serine/threonine protein phosphatase [Proteobacteria bacterium]|nr:serine/threonine protein phosphatase [Pseudomonadota bacterium]
MFPGLDLLKRFTTRHPNHDGREPSVPDGLRVYAIGDIHGRADLLAQLHRQIEEDAATAPDRVTKTVVYLGDYVDRGLDSKGVIDLILSSPLAGFDTVCLKGNHEDALLRFLQDISVGPDWLAIGGSATILSYGVRIPEGLSSAQRLEHVWKNLRAHMPQKHLEFLSKLDLMYRIGDYVFVHAGIMPGTPLDRQAPEDLMWIREEFLRSKQEHGAIVVHGHSPRDRPDIQNHRIGIDTGAFATNILTCLVLEGTTKRFLSTQ